MAWTCIHGILQPLVSNHKYMSPIKARMRKARQSGDVKSMTSRSFGYMSCVLNLRKACMNELSWLCSCG